MKNKGCPYVKVLTQKKAIKEKVGSFYHPTEKTYRTGLCPEGEILKKSYERKGYIKKNGTYINPVLVEQTCIKNKGLPGQLLPEYKKIIISKQNNFKPYGYSTKDNYYKRHKSLLEAIKELSYSSVVHKLGALRTFKKRSNDEKNKELYTIFNEDMKGLKKWRNENPNLYKYKPGVTKVSKKNKLNITNSNKNLLSTNVLNVNVLNANVTNANKKVLSTNVLNANVTNANKNVLSTNVLSTNVTNKNVLSTNVLNANVINKNVLSTNVLSTDVLNVNKNVLNANKNVKSINKNLKNL